MASDPGDVEAVIDRLLQVTGAKNERALAAYFGKTQGIMVSAKQKGHVPLIWIYQVAYDKGVRVEYLLTGELPITRMETDVMYFPPDLRRLMMLWEDFSPQQRQLLLSYADLIQAGGDRALTLLPHELDHLWDLWRAFEGHRGP